MEAESLVSEPIRPLISKRDQRELASAFAGVTALISKQIEERLYPGVVLLVAKGGEVIYHRSQGVKWGSDSKDEKQPPPVAPDTVFDIGSLTAAVATTTLFMKLIEAGKIKLTDRITNFIQGFGVYNKSSITVGDILAHTAGLPANHPYHEELMKQHTGARMGIMTSKGARDYVVNSISRAPLKHPFRSKQLYSDIGFIIMGHLVEVLSGGGLDKALHKLILQPLSLKSTSFIDLAMLRRKGIQTVTDVIAPTFACAWRQRTVWGEVFDETAWAMGGIAGHAGLFSTAFDLHLLTREIFFAYRGGSSYLKRETVRSFLEYPVAVDGAQFRCGWERPSDKSGLGDTGLTPAAFGFEGDTGCSLWIEPEIGTSIVLLTTHTPSKRGDKASVAGRGAIYKAVTQAVGSLCK